MATAHERKHQQKAHARKRVPIRGPHHDTQIADAAVDTDLSDDEARFTELPADLQHAIGCRNAAAVIRDHAKRDDLTIEAYVTDAIVSLNGDRESIAVLLSVVGLLAAEDERRGGGPLRVAEETFAAHATTQDVQQPDPYLGYPCPTRHAARLARARAVAAAWAATVPAGLTVLDALRRDEVHAAGGPVDVMTETLTGNDTRSDDAYVLDDAVEVSTDVGALLAEALQAVRS